MFVVKSDLLKEWSDDQVMNDRLVIATTWCDQLAWWGLIVNNYMLPIFFIIFSYGVVFHTVLNYFIYLRSYLCPYLVMTWTPDLYVIVQYSILNQ